MEEYKEQNDEANALVNYEIERVLNRLGKETKTDMQHLHLSKGFLGLAIECLFNLHHKTLSADEEEKEVIHQAGKSHIRLTTDIMLALNRLEYDNEKNLENVKEDIKNNIPVEESVTKRIMDFQIILEEELIELSKSIIRNYGA